MRKRSNRKPLLRVISSATAATLVLGMGAYNTYAATASTTTPTNALQANWDTIVSSSPTLANATVSAYAYDVTTHQVLADVNAEQRQTPASVNKLVTSAAALSALGPNFQYDTQVAIPQASANAAPGPIYLVGGGDPWLEANGAQDLEALASQVAATVKNATQVIGVSSLFAPPTYGIGWSVGDLPYNYAAGTSALMSERAEIQVSVKGTTTGQPPAVHLVFNSTAQAPEYFHIINNATTLPVGQPSTLSVTRELGTNNIIVTGGIASGRSSAPFLSIGDPARFTATLFQDLLKQKGVVFSEDPTTGTMPTGTQTIADHKSDTLANDLVIQNQFSINQMAENLYRMLGVNKSGTGSLQASAQAMTDFLQQAGVSRAGMQTVDGSGLSPLDEISAKQMVQLLSYASGQSWFPTLQHSMMQVNSATNAGILAYHPFNLPPGTNVWVKTGNLSNQWNYAGYAQAENGDLIAFAILNDGAPTYLNSHAGSPLDQMIVDAASWPNEPTGTTSAPTSADQAGNMANLPPQLNSLAGLLSNSDSGSVLGASIVNAATGQTVWSANGDKLLRAGLLPRLALADAGLNNSASFPGVTVEADGTISNGTLNGSLVIDGHNDPTLTQADLTKLAQTVKKAGIQSVTGPVEFVDIPADALWSDDVARDDIGQAFAAPASTLTVDKDVVNVTVQADGPNASPTVSISPKDAPIAIDNQLSVSSNASQFNPETDGQVQAVLRSGTNTYVLKGTLTPGKPVTLQLAPPNAGEVAAVAFRDALAQADVTVPTNVQAVAADPGAQTVASVAGPAMSDLIPSLLGDPSSETAQQVYTVLGDNADQDIANELGTVDQIVDPTGIGIDNYVTPSSLTNLLATAYQHSASGPLQQYLMDHLWRSEDPEVQTVAGYVRGSDGTVYAVAIIQSEMLWNGSYAPHVDK